MTKDKLEKICDDIRKVNLIFKSWKDKLEKNKNDHLKFYLKHRKKKISKENLFKMYLWAVQVSGRSYDSTKTFICKAEEIFGFEDIYNYKEWAELSKPELTNLIKKLHEVKSKKEKPLAFKKWEAIWNLAVRLEEMDEDEFYETFFNGKKYSKDLSPCEVPNLVNELEFVKETNAKFILRNLGGEFIKDDVWIKTFSSCLGLTINKLEAILDLLEIPKGLFDIVIWAYSEEYIGTSNKMCDEINKTLNND